MEDQSHKLKLEKEEEEEEEEEDDPSIVITFAPDAMIHQILGLPGLGALPPQINVPALQQGVGAAISKTNLVAWLDNIFEETRPHGKRSRNHQGMIIPGSYERLRANEYGRMEQMISNVLPLMREAAHQNLSAGQFRVFWGGGRGNSTTAIVKIGLFLDH